MSGWFTTWTFWVGVVWGFIGGVLTMWHWLVRPMGRALGWEKTRASRRGVPSAQPESSGGAVSREGET